MKQNEYQVIRSRHVTEKALLLEKLHEKEGNPSLARCKSPKYVFVVDPKSNKHEIARAVEEIYAEKNVKVVSVNTILLKPKKVNPKKKFRRGKTAHIKKAVVTLQEGESLE